MTGVASKLNFTVPRCRASISTPLRGVAKNEITGEDVRQRKRNMHLVGSSSLASPWLTAATLSGGAIAIREA